MSSRLENPNAGKKKNGVRFSLKIFKPWISRDAPAAFHVMTNGVDAKSPTVVRPEAEATRAAAEAAWVVSHAKSPPATLAA